MHTLLAQLHLITQLLPTTATGEKGSGNAEVDQGMLYVFIVAQIMISVQMRISFVVSVIAITSSYLGLLYF